MVVVGEEIMAETTGFNMINFLKQAIPLKASDIHIRVGDHPAMRIAGKMTKFNLPPLTPEDAKNACLAIMPEKFKKDIDELMDLDFAFELPGLSRFRVNINHVLNGLAIVIRLIPCKIFPLEDLNLPASVTQFTTFNNGLILVTGATGSGKSTTISSMINHINLTEYKHIVTIEDPVEFVYKNEKSIVTQRQVGIDTPTFMSGIKYSLRQDPDVVFIGEIRDTETITAALNAAETGHLVFATIHTNGAVQTINRVINMFEATSRDFVRLQLAKVLRGTISQKLIPLADGKGRAAACEVLSVTSAVQDYIERNKLEEIYELMQGGSYSGMNTMNMAIFDLYEQGKITTEIAEEHSDNVNELRQMFRGVHR